MAVRNFVAIVLSTTGLSIAVVGIAAFHRATTTVDPQRPGGASSLVTSGVYRWSRNPMYLGMVLVLLGWGAWLASPLSLLFVILFGAYLERFQIIPEERALRDRFGEEFEAYCHGPGRWL